MIYETYTYMSRHLGPVATSIILGAFYAFVLVVIFLNLSVAEADLRYFDL